MVWPWGCPFWLLGILHSDISSGYAEPWNLKFFIFASRDTPRIGHLYVDFVSPRAVDSPRTRCFTCFEFSKELNRKILENSENTYKKESSYELWCKRMQDGNAFPRWYTDATWGFHTSAFMKQW